MAVHCVDVFLSMMTNERKVSASTHNQLLSAILLLYRSSSRLVPRQHLF